MLPKLYRIERIAHPRTHHPEKFGKVEWQEVICRYSWISYRLALVLHEAHRSHGRREILRM